MEWRPGQPVTLETERFFLRSLTPRDADDFYTSWWNDAEIQRGFNNKPRNWDKARAAQHIGQFDNRERFHLGIYVKEGGSLIGFVTIALNGPHKVATTNVCLGDKSWWGKGVIVEARNSTMRFIFETLGAEKAATEIMGRNFSSIYNNRALGYKSEGVLRQHVPWIDGGRADKYLFGLLKNEWLEREERRSGRGAALDEALTSSKAFRTAKMLLADATYQAAKNIPDDAAAAAWGPWDSLAHVRLILAMENHLGKELDPDAIIDIASVADVARFIARQAPQ